MGKKKKKVKQQSGWSDDDAGFGANPFASALSGLEREPAKPERGPAKPATTSNATPDAEPSSTTPKRAVVRVERKGRRGKTVTVVTHLDLRQDDLERWCRDLRKTLGCGGTVERDTIVLQGDQRARCAEALEARGVRKVSQG